MKKLVLSLLCAGAMSVSANAMALVDGATYAVGITNGPVAPPSPAGTMSFSLIGDVARTACIWDVEWANNLGSTAVAGTPPVISVLGAFGGISTEFFVDQMKVQLGAGCATNAAFGSTIVTLDDNLSPPGTAFGFNRAGVPLPIKMLMLGQFGGSAVASPLLGTGATGLVCFGGLGGIPGAPIGLLANVVNGIEIDFMSAW